jgi:hypothetical protein
VVVVVDVVGSVDGGCAAVVSDVVALLAGKGGLVTRAVGSFSVWVVTPVVSVVVCVLKSAQSTVRTFFSKVESSSSGGSVCRAAHRRSGVAIVWVSTLVVVTASVWVLESFRVVSESASFDAMAFATSVTSIRLPSSTDTQCPYPCFQVSSFSWPFTLLVSISWVCRCVDTHIPGPCPSASHFRRSSYSPS